MGYAVAAAVAAAAAAVFLTMAVCVTMFMCVSFVRTLCIHRVRSIAYKLLRSQVGRNDNGCCGWQGRSCHVSLEAKQTENRTNNCLRLE